MKTKLLALSALLACAACARAAGVPWTPGAEIPWRLVFEDGSEMTPANSRAARGAPGDAARAWVSDAAEVEIVRRAAPGGGEDLAARVTARGKTPTMFELPARLRFAPEDVREFVFPGRGNSGVGLAFNGKFFRRQPDGRFLSYRVPYPPLFADFMHLAARDGSALAVFGVQPAGDAAPWRNPRPFVPGEAAVGADEKGGWYTRASACRAASGQTVELPAVRFLPRADLSAAIGAYLRANALERPLAAKVRSAAVLKKLKSAPLFLLHGPARDKIAALDRIRAPALIHYCDYLKGGFDKEYPDHLPPRAAFGSLADLDAFHDAAHKRGHLVSPYTNPTWWCDHPRGPTFLEHGEEPLAKDRAGKPIYEKYEANDGWTVTLWHPAVQAANRRTVRQFTEEHPVDLLFQDQCGARTWVWDFNPAAPSPSAWAEGILSMVREDSAKVPLGTEDGWDRCANEEAALCGLTWRIVPVARPAWRTLYKDEFPADCWRIEPVATRMFHDKALFYMHDLGSFVDDARTLAWMLALGYQLSWRADAHYYLADERLRDWYDWIWCMQNKVVSRIAGTPVKAFRHDRSALLAGEGDWAREADDGTVTAQYGDVKVSVNLGDVPRTVDGARLAPYGWKISAPGLAAAWLEDKDPYVEVAAEGRRYVYRSRGPVAAGTAEEIAAAKTPPCDAKGAKSAVYVIDLPGVLGAWVKARPDDWAAALAKSALVRRHGVRLARLTDAASVKAALAAGHAATFAIVNPYGEHFPTEGAGRWEEMLDAIRGYVAHGGIWVDTGGAPFYSAIYRADDGWKTEYISNRGLARLGADLGMTDINEPAAPLRPTALGARWLPLDLQVRLARAKEQVNRWPKDSDDTPVAALVTDDAGRAWFGASRLNGWGTLWRFGGTNPTPALAAETAAAALSYQYTHAPEPVPPVRHRQLTAERIEN